VVLVTVVELLLALLLVRR
jgi:hypothetical protein